HRAPRGRGRGPGREPRAVRAGRALSYHSGKLCPGPDSAPGPGNISTLCAGIGVGPMLSRRKRRSEFESTALPHLDTLYGAAHRMTRNPRDAEDLVQETMLRAYRFWDTFQKDSNCKAWLFRILTNTFINQYQKRKRSREVLDAAQAEQRATDGVLVHERAMSQRGPEDLLINRTLSDDVVRALEALPADFRVAVVLCDVEGFSYKE